jgi:hypothetical protein
MRGGAGSNDGQRVAAKVKTINKRTRKLEDRVCPAEPGWLLVMSCVWRELALDQDRFIEILRECEHLPTGPGFGIVSFCDIQEGLNAKELERYLREDGAKTRSFRGAQNT